LKYQQLDKHENLGENDMQNEKENVSAATDLTET